MSIRVNRHRGAICNRHMVAKTNGVSMLVGQEHDRVAPYIWALDKDAYFSRDYKYIMASRTFAKPRKAL